MPGKVKVKILQGRNLPVMDRGSLTTDAFVEVKLGNTCFKTEVAKKTLNPQWNSEWFRFEVDDAELQDEPLQVRIMDYDTYSANDAIGKVYINLNPLLLSHSMDSTLQKTGKGSVMSGWLPVYDTLQGIRGEVNLIVKVDLFSDNNKFRQSSCGVQFFYSPCVPYNHTVQTIHGFVEELIVNDDPEYQWIDKIRTPRASNEARHLAFLKLSGQLQRRIGLKAIEIGANAVLGYVQNFDLEGDIGVVARGSGTAVTLTRVQEMGGLNSGPFINSALVEEKRVNRNLKTFYPHAKNVFSIMKTDSIKIDSSTQDIKILLEQEDNRVNEDGLSSKWKLKTSLMSNTLVNSRKTKEKMIISKSFSDLPKYFKNSLNDLKINSNFAITPSSDGLQMTQLLVKSVMMAPLITINNNNNNDDDDDDDDNDNKNDDIPENKQNMIEYDSKQKRRSNECDSICSYSSNFKCDAAKNLETTIHQNVSLKSESYEERDVSNNETILINENISIPVGTVEIEKDSKGNIVGSHIVEVGEANIDLYNSLLKSDTDSTNWIKPGSTSNEPEIKDEPKQDFLHTLAEQFTDKLHSIQSHIPIHSNLKHNDSSSLLETAITTILLENLNICEASAGIVHHKNEEITTNTPVLRRSSSYYILRPSYDDDDIRRVQSYSNFMDENEIEKSITPFLSGTPTLNEMPLSYKEQMSVVQISEKTFHELKNKVQKLSEQIHHNAHTLRADFKHKLQELREKIQDVVNRKTNFEKKNSIDKIYDIEIGAVADDEESIDREMYGFAALKRRLSKQRKSFSAHVPEKFRKYSDVGHIEQAKSLKKLSFANDKEMLSSFKQINFSSLFDRNEALPSSPSGTKINTRSESSSNRGTTGARSSNINIAIGLNRRSSDSDLSITPKGNSLNSSDRINTPAFKSPLNQENLDMLEYPFLTISKLPAGFIVHLGATVSARSVKLLQRVPNQDEPDERDTWWHELRREVVSHVRSLACNMVVGYSEMTTISEDVCVLSATGTAALVNLNNTGDVILDSSRGKETLGSSWDKKDFSNNGKRKERKTSESDKEVKENLETPPPTSSEYRSKCSICHIPYAQSSLPFKTFMSKCNICRKHRVPDVILTTIEPLDGLHIIGQGCLISAQVFRYKRDLKSEANAKEISDGLPFLEYELHRQLICKLKIKGMNAIFGLKTSLTVGERIMAVVATGTGCFLAGLPAPKVPKIIAGNSWTDVEKLGELQKAIQDTMDRNRELYQVKNTSSVASSDTDDSEDEVADDFNIGNRDTCVLEVDDIQDLEVVSLLMESNPENLGFHAVNIQSVPGIQDLDLIKHLQMFTQVWRAKLPLNQSNNNFSKQFHRLLQTIFFKLRTMVPCALSGIKFLLDLPEADEIQILVSGMACSLGEPGKTNKFKKRIIVHSVSKDGVRRMDDDLIFNLEEDLDTDAQNSFLHTGSLRLRRKSPTRNNKIKSTKHQVYVRERYGVDITPLFNLPGCQIEKYLGNLNFFFIRESTSIRENGGISGFIHSFITELLAIVRAHVTALGGNAIVSFYWTEIILVDNPHKNQGQCLINVGGDVVLVSDYVDDS